MSPTASSAEAATHTDGDAPLYAAMLARDARFDGRFFVGVTSTGVYCRPVCRVRIPLRRNCRFFPHAAGAEAAGFRPCLRCRPELAPGLSLIDSPSALAQHAAGLMDRATAEGQDIYVPHIAAKLGVTDRHLRRIFQQAWGVTPLDYLNTRRLLQAKQLLTDTPLSVTQVAHASGFASLRRFNAAFAQHYRLSPSALRKQGVDDASHGKPAAPSDVTVRLGYRPPYDLDGVSRFLAFRAVSGLEAVQPTAGGLSFRRSLALPHESHRLKGWLSASFDTDRHEVRLSLSSTLLPALGALQQRVRQALDLDADPGLIDPAMAAVPAPVRPGLRLPGSIDGFESAVRVILGQQVTVAAARTLTQRLVLALGEPVETPWPEVARLFPTAQAMAEADPSTIGQLGIVRQRVGALQALARAVHEGQLELHRTAPLQPTLDLLRSLPGIGEWTVQLIAMRVLCWPDAFPASDIGVMNALGTRDVKQVQAMAEAWRPWRAYAVMSLWQTLET